MKMRSGPRGGAIGKALNAVCGMTVSAVQPIQALQIVRDGEIVWSQESNGFDVKTEWVDPMPLSGEHYYYLHVIQGDGEMAWSSPIWVTFSPE